MVLLLNLWYKLLNEISSIIVNFYMVWFLNKVICYKYYLFYEIYWFDIFVLVVNILFFLEFIIWGF